MADQNSRQDQNRFPALIGHSGTAGTAETVRAVFGPDGGVSITGLHGVVLTTTVSIANGTATAIPGTALANRKSLICYNTGTATIYLGGTGVTATNGIPVGTADYSMPLDLGSSVLYGIASTAGGTINVMEAS